jgi:hypothetical protein
VTNCPYCGQATFENGRCTSCGSGYRVPTVTAPSSTSPPTRWDYSKLAIAAAIVLAPLLAWLFSGSETVPIGDGRKAPVEQAEEAPTAQPPRPAPSHARSPRGSLDELAAYGPTIGGFGVLVLGVAIISGIQGLVYVGIAMTVGGTMVATAPELSELLGGLP